MANLISFDAAAEQIRNLISTEEADALIDVAVEQREDLRSAHDLSVEFGVDEELVRALQG